MNQLTNRLSVIDLTTIDRVKVALQNDLTLEDYTQDALISQLISDVSAQIVAFLGAHAKKEARTEVYEVRQHKRILSLAAFNVDASPLTIRHASTTDGISSFGALDATSYSLNGPGGFIRLRIATGYDPNYFEVTYTGGIGTDTADAIANYPDIAHAADLQVKYVLQRADTLGGNITAAGAGGGSVGKSVYTSEYGLLRVVQNILESYRRAAI